MRYADKLFGVFSRLHSTEEFPGTGVGLALAKRIIDRHGGTIRGEGEVNKGAAFFFTIPDSVKQTTNESPPPTTQTPCTTT
jgi:light-regulated signal transduction histidine kinase (bacteriophytochrome)